MGGVWEGGVSCGANITVVVCEGICCLFGSGAVCALVVSDGGEDVSWGFFVVEGFCEFPKFLGVVRKGRGRRFCVSKTEWIRLPGWFCIGV